MSTKDGPGLRTTVFLKGCPLRCLWCSNPESQSFHPQLMVFENLCQACGACANVCPRGAVVRNGDCYTRDPALCDNCGACAEVCPTKARVISGRLMNVEEVMKVVRSDGLFYGNSGGGVTFGGGEPTGNTDFLLALLEASRAEGYHTCVDTCGLCEPEKFKKVIPLTELFLFDCKHMSPEKHRELTGLSNEWIQANLREALRSGVAVNIRVPLMPGLNDSEENIAATAAMLREYDKRDVDILPCHAFGRNKYEALRREVPKMSAYAPDALKTVLHIFEKHGLETTIV